MRTNKEIKCDICEKSFNTYGVEEKHYYDYELFVETCYYPKEGEAHLVKNYICNECYNNIGNIVLKGFISNGKNYINNIENRKNILLKEYEDKLLEMETDNNNVTSIIRELENCNSILELSKEIIFKLVKEFPYTIKSTYYLDSALEIEKNKYSN